MQARQIPNRLCLGETRVLIRFWPGLGDVADMRSAISVAVRQAVEAGDDDVTAMGRIVEVAQRRGATVWILPRREGVIEAVIRRI